MMVTDTDRRDAAADVAYELKMLQASLEHRTDAFAWTSWFVHARNLMRFFDGKADQNDDILARHYFDPPGHWDALRESIQDPASYPRYEEACHKLAAHLTYARRSYRKEGIPPSEEITRHLLDLGKSFRSALPAEYQTWFGNEIPQ